MPTSPEVHIDCLVQKINHLQDEMAVLHGRIDAQATTIAAQATTIAALQVRVTAQDVAVLRLQRTCDVYRNALSLENQQAVTVADHIINVQNEINPLG